MWDNPDTLLGTHSERLPTIRKNRQPESAWDILNQSLF